VGVIALLICSFMVSHGLCEIEAKCDSFCSNIVASISLHEGETLALSEALVEVESDVCRFKRYLDSAQKELLTEIDIRGGNIPISKGMHGKTADQLENILKLVELKFKERILGERLEELAYQTAQLPVLSPSGLQLCVDFASLENNLSNANELVIFQHGYFPEWDEMLLGCEDISEHSVRVISSEKVSELSDLLKNAEFVRDEESSRLFQKGHVISVSRNLFIEIGRSCAVYIIGDELIVFRGREVYKEKKTNENEPSFGAQVEHVFRDCFEAEIRRRSG